MKIPSEILESLSELSKAIKDIERTAAIIKMTSYDNSYRPLIRIMCKLDLIRDWKL